jgi:adenylate cyclase
MAEEKTVGQEIERKFLVTGEHWRGEHPRIEMRQGYLSTTPERTVRVRLEGPKGILTIKGKAEGCIRLEYEYEIPADEAMEMLDRLCPQPQIEKVRHLVPYSGDTWEVDEFHGENAGLVVAELELESPCQRFDRPSWLGEEVTEDHAYSNSSLSKYPYSGWRK